MRPSQMRAYGLPRGSEAIAGHSGNWSDAVIQDHGEQNQELQPRSPNRANEDQRHDQHGHALAPRRERRMGEELAKVEKVKGGRGQTTHAGLDETGCCARIMIVGCQNPVA